MIAIKGPSDTTPASTPQASPQEHAPKGGAEIFTITLPPETAAKLHAFTQERPWLTPEVVLVVFAEGWLDLDPREGWQTNQEYARMAELQPLQSQAA